MDNVKIIIDNPMRLSSELCRRVIEKANKDTKIIICGSFIDNYKLRRNDNDNN